MTRTDRRESENGLSRRRLLTAGGGTLAAASAGCLATLPPMGRRVRYGRFEVPPPSAPTYRRWCPAPGAFRLEHDQGEPYRVMASWPGQGGEETVGARFTLAESSQASYMDYVGVGYENYDRVTSVGPVVAAEGSVDRSTVADTLADTAYEPDGTYAGRDVYARSDRPGVVAVDGDSVVYGSGPHARHNVETVVDTARGEAPRYHGAVPAFDRVSRAAGASPVTWVTDSSVIGADGGDVRMSALSYRFDGSAVYFVVDMLYPSGTSPPKGRIRRTLEDNQRALAAEEVDLSTEDELATVEIRMTHGEFRSETDGPRPSFPQITWGFDHDAETGTLTVRHDAGDAVAADPLSLEYLADEATPADTQFSDRYGTVSPGDELTLNVANRPADHLTLRYRPSEGVLTTLFTCDLGE